MMTSKASPKRRSVVEVVLRPGTFAPYVEHLATLLRATTSAGTGARKAELASALDGQPGRQLRKLYTIEALRETGTYFTGSALANRLVTAPKLMDHASQFVVADSRRDVHRSQASRQAPRCLRQKLLAYPVAKHAVDP